MRKKISIVTKRQWLKAYDGGVPQYTIALNDKRDVRTIKKGIEDAKRERDINFAHADLLKEALRKHNEDLMGLVEQMKTVLQPLSSRQDVPWKESDTGTLTFPGGKVHYETFPRPEVSNIALNIEAESLWPLLIEHLKHDPLPKALNDWRKTLGSYIEALMSLKHKMVELLKAKTGYQLENNPSGDHCLFTSAIDHLFRCFLIDSPDSVGIARMVEHITVESVTGQVKHGEGTSLAYARGEEEKCKNNIIDALNKLPEAKERDTLIITREKHRVASEKAIKAVEEIQMMRIVSGQCRICRRLGM